MDLDDFEEFEMEDMSRNAGGGMSVSSPVGGGGLFDDMGGDFGFDGMDGSSLPPLSSLQTNMFSTPDIQNPVFVNPNSHNQSVAEKKAGRISTLFACCLFCILLLCIIALLGLSIAVLVYVVRIRSDLHNLRFEVTVASNPPPAPLPPGVGIY